MALTMTAALREPTCKEMVEAVASHFGPKHVENSKAQLSASTQKKTESLTKFGHAVRKLANDVHPEAGSQIQDRLAKYKMLTESISDPQVCTKLRNLQAATLKDTLDEACVLRK